MGPTPAPLPPFGVHAVWTVLTSFSSGPWAVATLAAEIGLALWYWRAVARLAARGRRWRRSRSAAFAAGLACLAVAWQSGVPRYAETSFSVHVTQHVLLMLVAPILFGLAAPVTLALQTLRRDRKVQLLRAVSSDALHLLTNPVVAGVGNFGIMYWFFLDRGIVVSMAHPDLMDLVNVAFLVFGCLSWWPVVSPDYVGRRRYSDPLRVALGMVGMPFDSILAISLLAGESTISIAPNMYSLANVQAGASVFWILVMTISALGAGIPARRWVRNERRRGEIGDMILAHRGVVRGQSRYGYWGAEVEVGADGLVPVPWAVDPARPEEGRPGPGATGTT